MPCPDSNLQAETRLANLPGKALSRQKYSNNGEEISDCEKELKNMGFSEPEIQTLNKQIDGLIEKAFDEYFSKFYD